MLSGVIFLLLALTPITPKLWDAQKKKVAIKIRFNEMHMFSKFSDRHEYHLVIRNPVVAKQRHVEVEMRMTKKPIEPVSTAPEIKQQSGYWHKQMFIRTGGYSMHLFPGQEEQVHLLGQRRKPYLEYFTPGEEKDYATPADPPGFVITVRVKWNGGLFDNDFVEEEFHVWISETEGFKIRPVKALA